MGGVLFKNVATVAKFKKHNFKKPDKTLRNYNHTSFTMDGRIDMDVTFSEEEMCAPVYVKVNAHEQLLPEGVCGQLGSIQNHPDVELWRGGKK